MVADSRHEGGIGCEGLSEFAEQIPNGLELPHFLFIHPCVGYVSCKEDEVVGAFKMVFRYLLRNKMPERRESAHITKHCDVYLFQLLDLERRGFEILGL